MGIFVSFRNLSISEYLFIFNSLLIAIGRFYFICKTKFCNLLNIVTCHLFNIFHVSYICRTYHLSIPNFVELGSHIFLKTNLVIVYFTKNFDVYKCPHCKMYHVHVLPYIRWVLKFNLHFFFNFLLLFFQRNILIRSFLFQIYLFPTFPKHYFVSFLPFHLVSKEDLVLIGKFLI